MKILTLRHILLLLLFFGPLIKTSAQTTFADNFTTQAYNRNDGTGNWSTNWIETNDDGSPSAGDTFIFLGLGNVLAFVGDGANNNGGHGINRTVNLNGASTATLSFDWRTQGLDVFFGGQEELGIFMSNDNGASFTQIGAGTIVGNNIDSFSQDISAFISPNTVFRLQVIGGNESFEGTEFAFIDNLVISATFGPIVSIIDQIVNENVGTATITAQLTGGTVAGGFSVDYNTANNTAFAGSDYITSSGTLNFVGNLNETQTFTVPIVNNTFGESTETFFVNLSNISNISVMMEDGIITINDDGDPAIPSNVPLTLFDEFNGYYDYALTGGTFRDDDTNTCSIVTSSSNTLTTLIPATAVIEKAYLFWAHSGENQDEVVTFENQTVVADVVNRATFGVQPYHGMVSDVTTIVQGITNPSTNIYDVTDLSIDNTDDTWFYCGGNTTLGGWSLMIFYTEPTLPAVSINVYNGFDGEQNSSQSYTLSGFFAIGSTGSKTSVLSWEGDIGTDNNEILTLTTTSGTNTLNGDGDNDGTPNNPFNSTIFDNTVLPNVNNPDGRGIDLDTYDISSFIVQGESSATTNVDVGGDFVILNAVLLKVPSNLITGRVFEDLNYPGGNGRDLATSSGTGIEGVLVELYDNTNAFIDSDITDINGDYNIGGMANGTYKLRVVNNTVQSNRGGGTTCVNCLPVQTFRTNFASSTVSPITNEVGGANPAAIDPGANIIVGAQTVSTITILNEGAVGLDFGFNFNTIVNTNMNGQGSLEQFIVNANNLDETGLNIEVHPNDATLNPAAGEDTSIFNIPITDPGYIVADGYFDIFIPNSNNLSNITSDNTHIDGRTQTAYSGDTNTGIVGAGGTNVGTSGVTLPMYNLPEIQVHRNGGDLLDIQANNIVIRNIDVYTNNNAGIRMLSGSSIITECLIGVNANGTFVQDIDYGIEVTGGTTIIDSNYIADTTDGGIYINGGTSSTIQNNHITTNGADACNDNISIDAGSGIIIQNNLIENASAFGIDDSVGSIIIAENTITTSGQDITSCTDNSGISTSGSNSEITNNIINTNGGSGIALVGGTTSGNLISQNSIYANGTTVDALGIDISNNGVTINDIGDPDAGPNGSINFPVFEAVSIKGTTLKIIGWSRPGATIEIFLTDISQGTATAGDNELTLSQDYGEGQIFIGSAVEGSGSDSDGSSSSYSDADGNADNTNKFNFTFTLSNTLPLGTILAATATVSNTTSEFSNTFPLRSSNVITNRRITYRVTPNITVPTGTLTSDLTIDNFDDGQNGSGNSYQLQIRNTTAVGFNYQIWVQNVPYATIPGLSLGSHTLNTTDNGDGTYSYLFTSTTALGAFQSRSITGSGGAPSPLGIGNACGCITFYKL